MSAGCEFGAACGAGVSFRAMRRLALPALLALLSSAACSGVRAPTGPTRPLAPDEVRIVRQKSAMAVEQKQWGVAWDQEIEAGSDRGRLEDIALAAMAADSGPYEDMLAELKKKWGGLSAGGQTRASALAAEAEGRKDWSLAADILILTANDAPEYKAAWDLYGRAPVKKAGVVLDKIQSARRDWDEDHAKATK
jgi:hypothetical protein